MNQFVIIAALLIFAVSACKEPEPTPLVQGSCDNINYTFSDVQYIFENNCIGCHAYGGEALAAGDFSSYQGVEAALNADQFTFLSQVRWEMSDSDYNMPPTEKMSNDDVQKLECWIEAGYPQ